MNRAIEPGVGYLKEEGRVCEFVRQRRRDKPGAEGLDEATARIADELSKQYFLGYTSSVNKDGRWHSIRVTVRDRGLTVRARRGYVAS